MTRKQYLFLVVLYLTAVACGMTAPVPSSDGKKGSLSVVAEPTNYATLPVSEAVFVVIADSLQIRPCPYKEDLTCPPFEHGFVKGDVVMGYCKHFADGSIWLEFDGDKYSAIFYDNEWLMEGVCQ